MLAACISVIVDAASESGSIANRVSSALISKYKDLKRRGVLEISEFPGLRLVGGNTQTIYLPRKAAVSLILGADLHAAHREVSKE